ncbi:serine/threonine-protein phosphatase [candidate division KSB1 bacterium]|nr:serine/threonine-protein phosphatase [candidate division KSB1 bacterium]
MLTADASGHGVAAGLVMTMIKSQLFSLASEPHDAGDFFQRLNQCVRKLAPKNMFVTAAYVALAQEASTAAAQIEFATVGHPPILHYSAARDAVEELSTSATALGMRATLTLKPRVTALQRDDVPLLYTDGICEQMNPKKEQWGLERLKAELQQHHHLPLAQLCDRIMRTGAAFRGNAAAHDDMTLVAIRREAQV